MLSKTIVRTESEITFDSAGSPRVILNTTSKWKTSNQPQEGNLDGQPTLLLGVPYGDIRKFLLLFAIESDGMQVEWNGSDEVDIPSLFYTADPNYEVDSQGIVTPITITNPPTVGWYRFFVGEAESDQFVYPTGTWTGEETVP